jgi:hypothetical protein
MSNFPRKNDSRRRFSLASLAAAPTIFATLLGMFLVSVPTTRASENNERVDSSERCEELKFSNRNERVRRLAMENLRGTHVRAIVVTPNAGHSQLPDLDPPAGHRLANGLVAPLKC